MAMSGIEIDIIQPALDPESKYHPRWQSFGVTYTEMPGIKTVRRFKPEDFGGSVESAENAAKEFLGLLKTLHAHFGTYNNMKKKQELRALLVNAIGEAAIDNAWTTKVMFEHFWDIQVDMAYSSLSKLPKKRKQKEALYDKCRKLHGSFNKCMEGAPSPWFVTVGSCRM